MNQPDETLAPANPYLPPQSPAADPPLGSTPAAAPRPPRVWTVFVVFVLVCIGAVAAQIPFTIVLIADYLSRGGDLQQMATELPRLLSNPWNFIALAGSSQLALAAAALVPAWLSPVPFRQRLGLVPMQASAWWYPVIAVGAWLPALLGIALALALTWLIPGIPTDDSVGQLYNQMTWAAAGPFIAFIALAPGIFEELLFRGYIQRRLLERWPAWVAILVASLLFGLLHVMPQAVVFAFPIGLWLGIIAWRTGSVWPGIACHAFINATWNVYQIGTHLGALPDPLPPWVLIAGGALITLCFAATAWLMIRLPRQS